MLSSVIEAAIGIAGFAGIAAAIRQRNLAHWDPTDRIRLEVLLAASGTAIVFALAPQVLLDAGVSTETTWRGCSALLGIWIVVVTVFRVRQARASSAELPMGRFTLPIQVVLGTSQVLNLGFATSWLYLIGVLGPLANAFTAFVLLLLAGRTDPPDGAA